MRSLGNKVALLFFVITAAAFGVIYFWVVTQPESNLEERRLRDLKVVAESAAPGARVPLERRAESTRRSTAPCARWPTPRTRG